YFEYLRNMEINLTDRFAALSHPQRMDVLRLLLRRFPGAVSAGDIAGALAIKPATLSAYLTQLRQVGLISQTRQGTSLLYTPHIAGLRQMTEDLMFDCCRGRPDLCPPFPSANQTGDRIMSSKTYRVLFICSGNSARSIFAESLLRHEAGDRFEAYSAGTRPTSELNPMAVTMLKDKGHDVDGLSSKNVNVFQGPDAPDFDFVFTVCDMAANEDCPTWPGQPLTAHWGTPDPVKAEGTEAERMLAFQHAYGMLRHRIMAFSALPFETLDQLSLQSALDDIARMEAPE
ncbi:MAG: helix-turn-helix domain-containing protein, partial [Pseudomonadota bacterium]